MAEVKKVVPPNLPIAAGKYDQHKSEHYSNVLRLYFNQLSNGLNYLLDNQNSGGTAVKTTQSRGATWTNGNSAITVPISDVVLHIPVASTIVGWAAYGLGPNNTAVLGSCYVDVRRSVAGAYPPGAGDSIVGSNGPVITLAYSNSSSTLTGWTTSLNAGDALLFRLSTSLLFSQIFVQLSIKEV